MYAVYERSVLAPQYPSSQLKENKLNDTFVFYRQRQGNKIVSQNGTKFGPFLYRNTRNQVLVASYERPKSSNFTTLYTGCDIGLNADALTYYKNE
jgi:hypothetical protein